MYKAIKDNKIIAISDTDNEFPCLVKDTVETDETHTTDDYDQHNGEYLLKSEIPIEVTNEKIRLVRANLYAEQVDTLHAERQRKVVLGEWTEADEAEYVAEVKRQTLIIQTDNPYVE